MQGCRNESPLTIPQPPRGEIKRPDFLVGVPSIGTIAVDVKAKRVYRDAILIDAAEHRTLLAFGTCFNISVWFARFPPEDPHTCHLFLNRSLAGLHALTVKDKMAIGVPFKMMQPADERRDFMAAVMSAISLR